MKRLPRLLFATGAILIVVVALLISGLRLLLPELNNYRSQLLEKVQAISEVPVEADFVQGSWETFGPTLEARNIRVVLPNSTMQIERLTLALDVWQSLLHWRWQFRDLTFHRLQFDLNAAFGGEGSGGLAPNRISDLFLYQLDHFDLRDSRISFLTPSGERAEFHIPQLTWLNSDNRHRAEGQISLSTLNGQHGVVQLRLDMRDEHGLLNTGTIYMQADDIDMKPWFSRWLRANTGLESADFSLAAWLNIKNGEIYSGNALLKQGVARWVAGDATHRLDVDNLALALNREGHGWQVNVPQLNNLQTDGQAWSAGTLTALWLPENNQFMGPNQNEELRIRAAGIQLERLEALLPTFSFLSPNVLERWRDLQPQGKLQALALDIPLRQPEKTRFQAQWQDLSWQPWKLLPGVDHFSGALSGSVEKGRLTVGLHNSTLPYGDMFRAPLEISRASGVLTWQNNSQGWELASKDLDVQAKSLWINGDFRYQQPANDAPRLDILAGIRLKDAADAWRYFPEPLMGKKLVDYLSGALQGGQVDTASLIYAGNPHHFPFRQQDGQFQVYAPLRHATFQFQPEWPALADLAIDLDFVNDGLWMNAPQTRLGNVAGRNVTAVIPDYLKQKLFVDADIAGTGQEVHEYFKQTPLDESVGAALDELRVGGPVSGRLHLDIPLQGGQVLATGEVALRNNSLLVQPLASQLENVTGKFRFNNGDLESDTLTANWFDQPLAINFTTQEGQPDYRVNVALKGDWHPAKLAGIPPEVAKSLDGSASWQSQIAIQLPHQGEPSYEVGVNAELKKVSSYLPAPLSKSAGDVLPVNLKVQGGLNGFTLNGSAGKQNHFNSEWLLADQQVTLARAAWQTGGSAVPELPKDQALILNLPALDGEQWLALLAPAFKQGGEAGKVGNFSFPTAITLQTPQLLLGGQAWHNLQLAVGKQLGGMRSITAKGNEIDGSLHMPAQGTWRADLNYLYYNPQFSDDKNTAGAANPLVADAIEFHDWPPFMLRCESCWMLGQKLGRVEADLKNNGDSLVLTHGLVDTGQGRMTVTGLWKQNSREERSALQGKLLGSRLDQTMSFFGVTTPLTGAPYTIDFDLYWHGRPWKPQINTLNGTMKINLGKGEIENIGGGRAGQLLRLVSFDALLRKLQFDFRDTFGNGFYFDSIRGNIRTKDGIMHTDNLFIDGLSADIAMSGQVDLVRRQIDMQAVVAPELSATVGVATAFVINPIVGAAVFAASRVLGPLWSKISFIRYDISGSLDQPSINEVLRKPKEEKAP
ncbi:hypothetical protein Z042_09355 [Chania multitudinisentens RB-25]|uniref:YhdP central domain-containing protein n=1 Tax=Chania multitudinisentens RB-25 TaxID=1441930 RepID=W0L7S9_9GAMM|nr:AsmA2 domain-containing protein YhdP [Chania multitudinisentens]AHG19806.1 hypothetical protein Z042_09355 [Chania multitudinisentens RB-25]